MRISSPVKTAPRVSYSRPRKISERILRSPVSVTRICACKSLNFHEEYQEIVTERKQCPMCNSILIKKTRSSVQNSGYSKGGNMQTRSSVSIPRFSVSSNRKLSSNTIKRYYFFLFNFRYGEPVVKSVKMGNPYYVVNNQMVSIPQPLTVQKGYIRSSNKENASSNLVGTQSPHFEVLSYPSDRL